MVGPALQSFSPAGNLCHSRIDDRCDRAGIPTTWERFPLSTDHQRASDYIRRLLEAGLLGEPLGGDVGAGGEQPASPPRVPTTARVDERAVAQRWAMLGSRGGEMRDQLLDARTRDQAEGYRSNVENFIGTVKVPVGLAGPLRVRGVHARGDFYIPLATTEAALVASYSRGAQVLTEAGGCTAAVINEGVGRSPAFVFADMVEAGRFVLWVTREVDSIRREAEATTQHGRLVNMGLTVDANTVYMLLEFTTGDAAGQNMVTIATEAACRWIAAHSPVRPRRWFVEANMSGDKKASAQSFQGVRGRKVTAEALLPADVVRRRLRCDVRCIADYYRVSSVGGVLSGNIGIQGHYANGLAALFIACGQDAACVAEAAVGVSRLEESEDGSLHATVTLPNLIVGTVGGGTGLPSQQACLGILGLAGPGHANAFAEVAAAVVLAGEVSIVAALAAGEFTRAHRKLARREPMGDSK